MAMSDNKKAIVATIGPGSENLKNMTFENQKINIPCQHDTVEEVLNEILNEKDKDND